MMADIFHIQIKFKSQHCFDFVVNCKRGLKKYFFQNVPTIVRLPPSLPSSSPVPSSSHPIIKVRRKTLTYLDTE